MTIWLLAGLWSLSLQATADRYIRPALRDVFINLVTRPVEDYLARFEFESELLIAMYAFTDGFSGLNGGFGTPATGMNFLVHNMCRLQGSEGTWMIVKGGMGRVSREIAEVAKKAGAKIYTDASVDGIEVVSGGVTGVVLKGGEVINTKVVLSNADPFRLRRLVGKNKFPQEFNEKLDGMKRTGTTLKINLALDKLPEFTCLADDRGQHNATIHLLPQQDPIAELRRGFVNVKAGKLADFPAIEW